MTQPSDVIAISPTLLYVSYYQGMTQIDLSYSPARCLQIAGVPNARSGTNWGLRDATINTADMVSAARSAVSSVACLLLICRYRSRPWPRADRIPRPTCSRRPRSCTSRTAWASRRSRGACTSRTTATRRCVASSCCRSARARTTTSRCPAPTRATTRPPAGPRASCHTALPVTPGLSAPRLLSLRVPVCCRFACRTHTPAGGRLLRARGRVDVRAPVLRRRGDGRERDLPQRGAAPAADVRSGVCSSYAARP